MATRASGWTDTAGLRAACLKSWDRGDMLRELLEPAGTYPRRRPLKAPTAGELRQRFAEVRGWARELHAGAGHYRLETRSIGHQSVGANDVPQAARFDAVEDEIAFSGKGRDAAAFLKLAAQLEAAEPGLRPWVLAKPFQLLELGPEALVVARVARWLAENPEPGIYVRQLALGGVHTKFVEKHVRSIDDMAAVLTGMQAPRSSSMKSFRARHCFTTEPDTVRMRALPGILNAPGGAEDVEIPAEAFENLALPVQRVIVTENKTNFLALPLMPGTLIVFGGGYGFSGLGAAGWVGGCDVVYWGDLDTHGFAILNQLRSHHPHVRSVLMDKETLMDHRGFWGVETSPSKGTLVHLDAAEARLFGELVSGMHGQRIRLEQEQVNWDYALARIGDACGWDAVD
ncbi:Wadjet anti-phage system protein JetD domain-containing protein [Arthrobacter sp. AQ5-05]|uniref:Wadjet anti-phage system protein JetD domain-containing protein n=1 Tax=Arthrobacter sp. AQ5-05 TaxID=2184581 RepID=UPI0011BD6252|nr:Wadjet anti-phage system protein JetD domain-containing protein [Arthrobacter sp. AQ5-05]